MSVRGGMSKFHDMMKNDENTQKQYSSFKSGGLTLGTAGKDVYCDLMTSEKTSAECMGNTFKLSAFEKAIGGWKDLKHK